MTPATQFRNSIPETDLCPGALVRTVRRWSGGIHRALVHEVREVDGERWAFGPDGSWALPSRELEVIRPPVR